MKKKNTVKNSYICVHNRESLWHNELSESLQTYSFHTHTEKANFSPTRSSEHISSGARGHGGRTVSWGGCKRIYGIVDKNSRNANTKQNTAGPSGRQTHGCHKEEMSQHMERTGQRNERSASGKSRRIREICSPATAAN